MENAATRVAQTMPTARLARVIRALESDLIAAITTRKTTTSDVGNLELFSACTAELARRNGATDATAYLASMEIA